MTLSNVFIIYRYLDLTDDKKEKLRGYYKVAKKLEKLENYGQDRLGRINSIIVYELLLTLFLLFFQESQ